MLKAAKEEKDKMYSGGARESGSISRGKSGVFMSKASPLSPKGLSFGTHGAEYYDDEVFQVPVQVCCLGISFIVLAFAFHIGKALCWRCLQRDFAINQ